MEPFKNDCGYTEDRQQEILLQKIYFLLVCFRRKTLPLIKDNEWAIISYEYELQGKLGFATWRVIPLETLKELAPQRAKKEELSNFLLWLEENYEKCQHKDGNQIKMHYGIPILARAGNGQVIIGFDGPKYLTDSSSEDEEYWNDTYTEYRKF